MQEIMKILPEDDLHCDLRDLIQINHDMLNYMNLGISYGKENIEEVLDFMDDVLEEIRDIQKRAKWNYSGGKNGS